MSRARFFEDAEADLLDSDERSWNAAWPTAWLTPMPCGRGAMLKSRLSRERNDKPAGRSSAPSHPREAAHAIEK